MCELIKQRGSVMNNYKIIHITESDRYVQKIFSGESEGEAIEAWEFWADGQGEYLKFHSIEEV